MRVDQLNSSPLVHKRRLLQFRLKTLLLIPLLLGLFHTFSDQAFDHFIYLMLAYGGIFGSLWSIGSTRLSDTARQGARRVVGLAGTAALGGLASGMVAGGPALAMSLWRSDPNWVRYWVIPGIPWQAKAFEACSIVIGGIWVGGLLAAAGGILFGVPIACLRDLGHQRQRQDGAAAADIDGDGKTRDRLGWRVARLGLACGCAALLVGPAAWILYHVVQRHFDERAISDLRIAGIEVNARSDFCGPNWLERMLSSYGCEQWLERLVYLAVVGDLKEQAWQRLETLHDLEHLSVRPAGITDERLSDVVGRLNCTPADRFGLDLSESRISDAGLRHLSGLIRLESLGLRQTLVTDDGLMHLAELPNLTSLILMDTVVTPHGIANLRNRSRATFRVY